MAGRVFTCLELSPIVWLIMVIELFNPFQAVVRASGEVSQFWSNADANVLWNQGEVLMHKQWWCPLISLSQGLLLINVLGNQILKRRGNREDQERWFVY